jgi:hypothetical protein
MFDHYDFQIFSTNSTLETDTSLIDRQNSAMEKQNIFLKGNVVGVLSRFSQATSKDES